MKVETKKCLEMFCEACDIATNWLLDSLEEGDPIEKQINFLHYLKADKKRFELAGRLKRICQT